MEKQIIYYVITALGVLSVGCWYYVSSKPQALVPPVTNTVLLRTATSSNTTKAPEKLLTYRNEEIGFEFSYPKDDIFTGKTIPSSANPNLILSFVFDTSYFDEWFFNVEKTNIKDIEKYPIEQEIKKMGIKEQHYITLSGERARVTTFVNNGNGFGDDIYIQTIHDGKIFSLLLWGKETGGFADTILSTFKFLK